MIFNVLGPFGFVHCLIIVSSPLLLLLTDYSLLHLIKYDKTLGNYLLYITIIATSILD